MEQAGMGLLGRGEDFREVRQRRQVGRSTSSCLRGAGGGGGNIENVRVCC